MTRVKSVGLLAAVALFITASGCHETPPPPPPPPPPVWQPPTSRADQTRELSQRVEELNASLAGLPGESTEEHRKMAADIFENLSKILRLAMGNDANPQFNNRIAVIDGSQATLSNANLPRPQLEASENEAVRASIAALEQIQAKFLSDDDTISSLLEQARAQLDAMYKTGGPMHDLVAADGIHAVNDVVQRVNSDLVERYGKSAPAAATAAPTTGPS